MSPTQSHNSPVVKSLSILFHIIFLCCAINSFKIMFVHFAFVIKEEKLFLLFVMNFLRNFRNEEEEEDVHGHENAMRKLVENLIFSISFILFGFHVGGLALFEIFFSLICSLKYFKAVLQKKMN